MYYKSTDEAYWLAFFLILSDGFSGFLGTYEVSITVLPGLPSIELSQLFILLTLIKASSKKASYPLFYKKPLSLFFIYLGFTILWGLLNGFPTQLNEFFRIFKLTFPLLIFYSIPVLFKNESDYERIFSFIFPIVFVAFATHVFSIIIGMSPAEMLGARDLGRYAKAYSQEGSMLRVFYNPQISLLSFFGSLFFLSKHTSEFPKLYLATIIILIYFMVFLSGTRGWIISFTLILLIYSLYILRLKTSMLLALISSIIFIIFLAGKSSLILDQVKGSWERVSTLNQIFEGDLTLGGTQSRTTLYGPQLLSIWKENPIFGWGYSNTYFEFNNGHAGNQNILMHAGLVGSFIMLIFFLKFNLGIIALRNRIGKVLNKESLIVFPLFFLGWFIIHSTSGQHFAYGGMPNDSIAKAVFFSFGALIYYNYRCQIQKTRR